MAVREQLTAMFSHHTVERNRGPNSRRWITAAFVPRSWNTVMNTMTSCAMPTKPYARGGSTRATKDTLMSDSPCAQRRDTPSQLAPESTLPIRLVETLWGGNCMAKLDLGWYRTTDAIRRWQITGSQTHAS